MANISPVLNPSSHETRRGQRGHTGLAFHFSLSPVFFPPSAAHKRLRPVCDVAVECSQNELITDEGRRAFETWHRTTFFKHLKIVTVGFFSGLFFHFGASSAGFFGDWNHNQILLPPSCFFLFVIGSLFNLARKIGSVWERHNSFGGLLF